MPVVQMLFKVSSIFPSSAEHNRQCVRFGLAFLLNCFKFGQVLVVKEEM